MANSDPGGSGMILINGLDVSEAVIKYELRHLYGTAIATGTLLCNARALDAITDIKTTGATIEINRRFGAVTQKVFLGQVKDYDLNRCKYTIEIEDKLALLTKHTVTRVYGSKNAPMKISDVLLDIIIAAGLQCNASDTGASMVTGYVCRQKQSYAACQDLCNTIDYQLFYDPRDDMVHATPLKTGTAIKTFETGSTVTGTPKHSKDRSQLFNDITVITAAVTKSITENFTLVVSGVTALPLAYRASRIISVNYEGTDELVPGIEPDTTTGDYYIKDRLHEFTYDITTDVYLHHNHAGTLSPGDQFNVEYEYQEPYASRVTNYDSIYAYGLKAKVIHRADLYTQQAGIDAMNAYLASHKDPVDIIDFRAKQGADRLIWVGDRVTLIDHGDNITHSNKDVIRMTIYYPKKYDEVQIGTLRPLTSDYVKSLENRINQLEAMAQQTAQAATTYYTVDAIEAALVTLTDDFMYAGVTPEHRVGYAIVGYSEVGS